MRRLTLIIVLIAAVSTLRAQNTTPDAERQKQAQATEQRRQELQQQLQQAYEAQQKAKQQEANAQAAAMQARQQANQHQTEANKAALNSGMDQGVWTAASKNVDKRLQMVTSAVHDWKPPQGYVASSAATVSLADPFAPTGSGSATQAKDLSELTKALEGSCLAIDNAHGVARVARDCAKQCKVALPTAVYPLLPDGSPLERPEQVSKFFDACKGASELTALASDGSLVTLK